MFGSSSTTSSRASGDSRIRRFSPFDEPLADIFEPVAWDSLGLSWEFPGSPAGAYFASGRSRHSATA
jgi:hypothetical protein